MEVASIIDDSKRLVFVGNLSPDINEPDISIPDIVGVTLHVLEIYFNNGQIRQRQHSLRH